MDIFAPFEVTASAASEPPGGGPGPPPPGAPPGPEKKEEGPKEPARSPARYAELGRLAIPLLVAVVLGGVAAWERMPKSRPSRGRIAARYVASEVALPLPPTPPATPARRAAEPVPVPPVRPSRFASFDDDLPDYGGADDPVVGDDIDFDLIEERLRERLRREGKLPPEPGAMEEFRRQMESAKDAVIRHARGGQP